MAGITRRRNSIKEWNIVRREVGVVAGRKDEFEDYRI